MNHPLRRTASPFVLVAAVLWLAVPIAHAQDNSAAAAEEAADKAALAAKHAADAVAAAIAEGKASPDDEDPAGEAIYEITHVGPGDIDIPADRRSDLSQCDGTSNADVVRAVQTCWPLLQYYRQHGTLMAAMEKWRDLPGKSRTKSAPEYAPALAAADVVIAAGSDRRWPAVDIPLSFAYFAKARIAADVGDTDHAIELLRATRTVVAGSQIENRGFLSGIKSIDRRIAMIEYERDNPDED